MKEAYRMETLDENANAEVERREHKRHSVPVMITCTFYEGGIKGKSSFQGFIQDISCGGVAIEIRDDYLKISEALLLYTTTEMSMALNFPDGVHHLQFSGVIRWCKRRKEKDKNCLYLGIKFNNLSQENQALVESYIALGKGDKNLIWNLWDNLTNHVEL
jgi:hypothetical protein